MDDIVVSNEGVTKLLKGLNPSKALGPDEFHPNVLKELAIELGPVFAHLFQKSLDTREIPKEWSLANICPLYKKGDRAFACNYRPVSLTFVPYKLLEHIVCSNIMAHLDKYKLLSDRQHAFRNRHSCETQLTTVINDWAKRYRSIGMLGKEIGYEISTCQMQYDANNKETDQNDPCLIYSGGNGPRKKYLGVTITNDLRWNTHVSNICTKANRILGFLRRNLYSCPQEVKEAAYKGLVRQDLRYSGSVWDPSGVGLQNELKKVQNRAARFVTGNYNFETGSMTGILEHLKWESLKKRRKDNRLILLYKGLKGKASIPTDDLIPLVRRCRNGHSMAYQVPIANTDIYKCSFFP